MRKISLLASSWLLACFSLSASSISPEQALLRLANSMPTRSSNFSDLKLANTICQSNGEPGLYIFENKTDGGYAILSADDSAAPLLGYSDTGNFDNSSMSPEMEWWLQEYTRQIEYAAKNGAGAYEANTTRSEKQAITPLIKTKWNQNAPYNLQTPEVNGRNCVTGCVATAMAQVMNYWKYPTTGKGMGECTVIISTDPINTETYEMPLDERNFDWENMKDSYDEAASDEQIEAVAYLMKACGYATKMRYSLNQSTASTVLAGTALIENFGYNSNMQYCQRAYFSATDWSDMVYEELSAGNPVIYGGQSLKGGHAFICDGYASNGYFHFNWGWGGIGDGYYLLDALNPDALGIGANGGRYNINQAAVVGIQRTKGKEFAPNFAQNGNMVASLDKNMLTLTTDAKYKGWYNRGSKSITIDIATEFQPVAPTTGEPTYKFNDKNRAIPVNSGYSNFSFDLPSSLKNGTYKVTLCFRLSGTEKWTPVRCKTNEFNYIEIIKNGSDYTIIQNEKAQAKIDDAEFMTPLYFGNAVKMSVTVSNPSDKEITNHFYPALYSDGKPQMIAEGVTLTLEPGETVTKEFVCQFELLREISRPTEDKTYQLQFYDPADSADSDLLCYPGFSKDVDMKTDDLVLDVSIDYFEINGCETYTENGTVFYKVTDASSIPFSITITNNATYFAKPVNLVIFPYIKNPDGPITVTHIAIEPFSPFALLGEGENATLSSNVNLTAGEIGNDYSAVPYIDGRQFKDNRIYFTLEEYNSVDNIEREDSFVSYDKATGKLALTNVRSLVLYAMDGTAYDKTSESVSGSVSLTDLPAGIYIVKAIGCDGTIKTVKIIR